MRALRLLVIKEFLQIVRDRATLAQLLLIPFVQLVVLSNAATFTVRDARVVVVDRDRSALSARLVTRLGAGREFQVIQVTPSAAEADAALVRGRVTVVLDIPPHFERDLTRQRVAPLQLALNAEQGAVAGLVAGYAQRIIADEARDLAVAMPVASRPMGPAPALAVSARSWYNETRDYKHYMVPAILVSLVTIIGTIVTAQNVAREREIGTLEQLNVTPASRGLIIAGKLLPAWLIAMGLFTGGLALAKLLFGIPTRGPVPVVVVGAGVYLLLALGIGLLVSTVTRTQQQAMFVSFFVLMIYLLMSGIFTPLESMPAWAQEVAFWTPVRHFVWVMRAVLVRGAGVADVWMRIAGLGVAGVVVLGVAVNRYHKSTD